MREHIQQLGGGSGRGVGQVRANLVMLRFRVRPVGGPTACARLRHRVARKGSEEASHSEADTRRACEQAQARDEANAYEDEPERKARVRSPVSIEQPAALDEIGAYVAQRAAAEGGARKTESVEGVVSTQLSHHRVLERREGGWVCMEVDR